jgi:hypothetical protein
MTDEDGPREGPTDADDRVAETLRRCGASVVNITAGGVDFASRGIPGFARTRRGRLRASFFLAVDHADDDGVRLDVAEAVGFAARMNPLPLGEVEYFETEELDGVFASRVLRYLVELAFDDVHGFREASRLADDLASAWDTAPTALADLRATLSRAGVVVPPLVALADQIGGETSVLLPVTGEPGSADPEGAVYRFGPWHWGSAWFDPRAMYDFDAQLVAQRLVDTGAFFALSHAGHGWNSYGLNLVVCAGPVAFFVQHAYGGTFTNPVRDLVEINTTYSRLHVLLPADPLRHPSPIRWLALHSTFRGATGLVDLDRVRGGETVDDAWEAVTTDDGWRGDEGGLFTTVADRLGLTEDDFGVGGPFTWGDARGAGR